VEWKNDMPDVRAAWLYRQIVRVEDGVVVIIRDITERKQTEEKISHMAHHDALTGLPNRTLLEDRIQQAMLHAQRYGRCVTLVFMDLDNFKLINDTLGHKAGDELLKTVASRMVSHVRQTDTVMRLGGDEFVIVLADQSDKMDTMTPTLQKLREAIAEPIYIGDQKLEVTSSMGLAIYPADGTDSETLLMHADAAMYQAKALGRNNYQFYTAEMNTKVQEKLLMQEGLRSALLNEEFFLAYQPQIDMQTGRTIGVEALIRWRHPERGIVSPCEFIGLAEETGLIVPIGEWVLRTACKQAKAWQDAGMATLSISVNVSARQFRDNTLTSQVTRALRESGLEPCYLDLELTESLIMQNLQQAVSTMQELKAMGIQLSIDDFGTGYSNLSALKSFPITRLKLDRSFVCDLPDDEDDKAIARAVILLAHELDLRVVAEGVEMAEQHLFLQTIGCDEMQGFYFSKPLQVQEIESFLNENAQVI
jgi:diguanylate cyclase (GGDEF)-like protein